MQEIFISFYDLHLTGRLKREQLENFVISLVVRDQVYVFIFNLIQLSQYEAIKKLDFILQSAQVTLESLNVKPIFILDAVERDAILNSKKE